LYKTPEGALIMFRLFPIVLALLVSLLCSASAFAQPTRDELTQKKRLSPLEQKQRVAPDISKFRFDPKHFLSSRRPPDLFNALAVIVTTDLRVYRDMLVKDALFDYNDGAMTVLEAELPEIRPPVTIFEGKEILTVTFVAGNGRRFYYVRDRSTGVLRPASRGMVVTPDAIAVAERQRRLLAAEYGEEIVARKTGDDISED